jgi:hypothetical protein
MPFFYSRAVRSLGADPAEPPHTKGACSPYISGIKMLKKVNIHEEANQSKMEVLGRSVICS